MRKPLSITMIALVAVMGMLANGQAAEKVYKLRLAHATVADTQDRIANEFVKLLGEMSKGRIDGKVYNASQLGDNEAMNQGVQSGSIEAHIEPSAFFAPYSKIFGIMNLPFLWKNSESSLRVANDPAVLKTFEESAAKVGVKIVSFYTFGPQHLATRFPIKTAEDLKGKKFRVFPSPIIMKAFESWGASAISLPLKELYTALQTGTVDGQENPLGVIYRQKIHEVAPYITLTDHLVLINVLIVNKKWYEGLGPELQKMVMEAGAKARQANLEIEKEDASSALKAMEADQRVKIHTLPGPEREKLRTMAKDVYDFAEKSYPEAPELLKKIAELQK